LALYSVKIAFTLTCTELESSFKANEMHFPVRYNMPGPSSFPSYSSYAQYSSGTQKASRDHYKCNDPSRQIVTVITCKKCKIITKTRDLFTRVTWNGISMKP